MYYRFSSLDILPFATYRKEEDIWKPILVSREIDHNFIDNMFSSHGMLYKHTNNTGVDLLRMRFAG